MRSCAIHVHKHSVEAMLLQQCREVTTVILSITPWLPTYMGQSLIRCNTKNPKNLSIKRKKCWKKSKQFLDTLGGIKPCRPPSRQPIRQGVILFFLNSKGIHKHHPPLVRHFNLSSIAAPGWRAWNERTSARGKCSRGSSVHPDSSRKPFHLMRYNTFFRSAL